MGDRSFRLLLALTALAVLPMASSAVAQTALPESRTHVDANDPPAVQAGDGPRLTLLAADTSTADVRMGYLYVKAKCSATCTVEVTAKTRINGKVRKVAFTRKALPARRTRRVKMRIKSRYRDRVSPNARFSYRAVPFPRD